MKNWLKHEVWLIIIASLLALFLLIAPSAFSQTPVDFQKWKYSDTTYKMQFGGSITNYQKPDSTWTAISNNWVMAGDTITNRAAILQTDVYNGKTSITVKWNENTYTISSTLKSLGFYKWTDSTTYNIDNTPNWGTRSVDSNIIKWTGVFPGVDYKMRKSNGTVGHGIFFKPAFLDSMVALLDQRSDSSDIYLANVMKYELSSNIDDYNVHLGNIRKRKLKQFSSYAFELRDQQVFFPGYDTLAELPVWQRHQIVGGDLYVVELVKAVKLREIHAAYPEATIWHNSTFNIDGSAANVDAARISKYHNDYNYGMHSDLMVGDEFEPGDRENNSVIRFNTLADSMRAVGAATWDSARIGLIYDYQSGVNDSLCITWHKITETGWLEGDGTGQVYCGVTWDSANQRHEAWCPGSSIDWTDGGAFSATRETYASHPDSIWLTSANYSYDDTVFLHISPATLSDTMGNKAGILIRGIHWVITPLTTNCYYSFDSDNVSNKEPVLDVWYTTGDGPVDYLHGPDGTGQLHGPDGSSVLHKP